MRRPGSTLVEISLTLILLGLVATMGVPRLAGYRDRVAADAAAASAMSLLTAARYAALRRSTVTAVRFDTSGAIVTVFAGVDTLVRRDLGAVHGVRLSTTRDSIAYGPSGLGYGAANTQVVLWRGAARETVTVSRLGRARR